MPRCLLVVRRRHWVRGKGLAVEPGIVPVEGDRLQVNDRIALRRPDGSTLELAIRGISAESRPGSPTVIHLFLDGADPQAVPVGSEVWSVDV